MTLLKRNDQTWLICGGRNFADQGMFDAAMAWLVTERGLPAKVVHGGARGADALAAAWAASLTVEVVAVPADWDTHGRAAGVLRNQKMLDDHKPDLVIAFPGSRGTADMVRRARQANCPVIEAVFRSSAPTVDPIKNSEAEGAKLDPR